MQQKTALLKERRKAREEVPAGGAGGKRKKKKGKGKGGADEPE